MQVILETVRTYRSRFIPIPSSENIYSPGWIFISFTWEWIRGRWSSREIWLTASTNSPNSIDQTIVCPRNDNSLFILLRTIFVSDVVSVQIRSLKMSPGRFLIRSRFYGYRFRFRSCSIILVLWIYSMSFTSKDIVFCSILSSVLSPNLFHAVYSIRSLKKSSQTSLLYGLKSHLAPTRSFTPHPHLFLLRISKCNSFPLFPSLSLSLSLPLPLIKEGRR